MKTTTTTLCTLVSCSLMMATTSSTEAALTLTVDTATQTVKLTGSETATFSDFGANPYKFASWQARELGGGSFGDFGQVATTIQANDMWSSSVGTPTVGFYNVSFFMQIDPQGGGIGGQVMMGLFNTVSGPTTVTGLGKSLSYALLEPENILLLEGMIGSEIPLSSGSGFSGVSVVGVPEPSSALLFLMGFGAFLVRRKK